MPDPAPPLARSQFPISETCIYFNHAAYGPISWDCADKQQLVDRDWLREACLAATRWEDHAEHVRSRAATLLGAGVDEVAFVKNTTEGLAFVANGLPWSAGDRVVLAECEFPSVSYPFLHLADLGVEIDWIRPDNEHHELPLECFEHALETGGGRVRLVVVSWVQSVRGWRTDLAALAELCHRHDALLCIDAIQALGVFPANLSAWGVDFAAADAHKWLVGPQGIGLLYVTSSQLANLRPSEAGWNSVIEREVYNPLQLDFDTTARRYEGGTLPITPIAGLGASIDLLLETGIESIADHVFGLTARLTDQLLARGAEVLSSLDDAHRSGIVSFRLPHIDSAAAVEALATGGIVGAARGEALRFSPHGWNTADEIDRAIEAIDHLIENPDG